MKGITGRALSMLGKESVSIYLLSRIIVLIFICNRNGRACI